MSDKENDSDSSSSSEDLSTTGLIATRTKRATAGNLYATLRANLDDEELQKELLAEDEEGDAGDYEVSDKAGDEDDELESSSEDEDAGPPKEGEVEELEGEKALKRQERVEAKRKRKVQDARLRLPAWQKKKRVKLADDVKTEDGGSTSERPRKKSERSNWLPTAADLPVRQSARSTAVANREVIHANLKQSAERSERQRKVMKVAAERDKTKRRMDEMSQADRLKKCEKIERETAREFGRWEREEAERQRAREEALAAKRRKGIEGPYVRWWSGSVVWEGEKIRVRRVSHGSKKVEELKEEKKEVEEGSVLDAFKKGELGDERTAGSESAVVGDEKAAETKDDGQSGPPQHQAEATSQQKPSTAPAFIPEVAAQNSAPWLQGIQEYTAHSDPNAAPAGPVNSNYTPSAPNINSLPEQPPSYAPPSSQPLPQMYHGWPPGTHQFTLQPSHQQQQPPPPPQQPPAQLPPPPAPLLREQAQRTLVILSQFPSLDTPAQPTKRTYKTKNNPDGTSHSTSTSTPAQSQLETNPLKSVLVPNSHPTFTPDEAKYLSTRPRKRTNLNEYPLPPPPPRMKCAVTCWTAKFRDPKTGLGFADMHQYKAIQRVVAGGCAWSGVLGAWVGPRMGAMGRPARGVPEGFAGLGKEGGGGTYSTVKSEG